MIDLASKLAPCASSLIFIHIIQIIIQLNADNMRDQHIPSFDIKAEYARLDPTRVLVLPFYREPRRKDYSTLLYFTLMRNYITHYLLFLFFACSIDLNTCMLELSTLSHSYSLSLKL